MAARDEIQARKDAVMRYLEEDAEQSVHSIAKRLNNEYGGTLLPGEIAIVRQQFLSLRQPPAAPVPAAMPAKVTPRCSNCGGTHWVSQCPSPFPEPAAVVVEEDMSTVATLSPSKAEVVVTAPHPESRKRTTAGRMMRRQYVNELLDEDPALDPQVIMGKLKERFGVALDWRYVYETCRVARDVHHLPQVPEYPHENGRKGGRGEPLPTYEPEDELAFADTPDEECRWLAQQANDIMRAHGLTELRLVVENGKAKWVYKVVKTGEGEVSL